MGSFVQAWKKVSLILGEDGKSLNPEMGFEKQISRSEFAYRRDKIGRSSRSLNYKKVRQ
jgi:hypothetical protein